MPTPAEIQRIRELLPTTLGSEELRAIPAEILRRSVFSARCASASYLSKVREICARLSSGEISQADARNELGTVLEQMGHSPIDGGGLKNPASIRRLNLIVETQTQMAASVATLAGQTPGVLAQWPAWELARVESRSAPRPDWAVRWRSAASSVGFDGVARNTPRMVALKSSPVWQALGDGAGGFTDTLRNPYPPFAYSSGLGWIDVGRDECERLGLDVGNAETTERPTLSPGEQDIKDAIARYGMPDLWEGIA